MTENEQDLQTVMESTGCDRWIARKALTSSDGNVHNAMDLVKKRMSYQTSKCRCGELIAEKWSYCPYCGTKKEGRPFDGVLPNDPLTLEQLRAMDGEPVWITAKGIGRYDVYQGCANRCLEQFYKAALPSSGYGTDWLAYRRKLEGKDNEPNL